MNTRNVRKLREIVVQTVIEKPSIACLMDIPTSLCSAIEKGGRKLDESIEALVSYPYNQEEVERLAASWGKPFIGPRHHIPSQEELVKKWEGSPTTEQLLIIETRSFRIWEAVAERLGVDLSTVFLGAISYAAELADRRTLAPAVQ